MGSSKNIDPYIQQKWKELGFFFEFDEAASRWRFVGDKNGLLMLVDLLRNYSNDSTKNFISEHEHLGPYMQLKIMTSTEPELSVRGISGTLSDIRRLAEMIAAKVANSAVGDSFVIAEEFAGKTNVSMEINIARNGFEPGSMDQCAI